MRQASKIILGGFLLHFVGISGHFVWATETPDLQSIQDRMNIPDHVARVTDAYMPSPASSMPDYILIQDVHRHPQVQSRIALLIVHGYERWGVKKVFMEGAFTPLDVTVFHRVPRQTQKLLVERLVKDGNLSGPELAAVLIMEREWRNPPVSPFQLFGMEDPKLYRENVLAYQTVMAHRESARRSSPIKANACGIRCLFESAGVSAIIARAELGCKSS